MAGGRDQTASAILALFDAEMRRNPHAEAGVTYQRAGCVVRAFGAWNAVVFAEITPANADAVIAEQVRFFRSIPEPAAARDHTGAHDAASGGAQSRAIEWKVYGHDRPADLGSRLAAAGFEPDEPETLMIFDLAGELRGDSRPESSFGARLEIRRATDAGAIADAAEAARAAFGRDEPWRATRAKQNLAWLTDPAMSIYVAYLDGRPVASARAEFPAGRPFAGLWGGGTLPEYRGRGIYRALVWTRAEEARRRGYRYLRVDARETSRPILERLGFMPITSIVEWRLPLPGPHAPGAPDTARRGT